MAEAQNITYLSGRFSELALYLVHGLKFEHL